MALLPVCACSRGLHFSLLRRGKCWPIFPGARVDLWSRPGSAPRFSYGAVDESLLNFSEVVSALGFRALFGHSSPKSCSGRFQPKIRGSNFEGQSFCRILGENFLVQISPSFEGGARTLPFRPGTQCPPGRGRPRSSLDDTIRPESTG